MSGNLALAQTTLPGPDRISSQTHSSSPPTPDGCLKCQSPSLTSSLPSLQTISFFANLRNLFAQLIAGWSWQGSRYKDACVCLYPCTLWVYVSYVTAVHRNQDQARNVPLIHARVYRCMQGMLRRDDEDRDSFCCHLNWETWLTFFGMCMENVYKR